MNMLKRNFSILAIATLALLAAHAPDVSAQAKERVRLAVWGGGSGKLYKDMFAADFTAKTGYEIDIVEVPSPTAAIMATNGSPDFNAAIASSYEAAELAAKGFLTDFNEAELPAIKQYPNDLRLMTPKGDRFAGMPVYFIYYGIAYNKDNAKAEDFQSWKALTDPKWKGQIGVTRAVYLAPYDLTLFAYLNGGSEKNLEPGVPMLEAMVRNALTVYSSMGNFNSMIARGELTAAPYYSILKRQGLDKKVSFDVILPKEGGLMLPYTMVQPKNSKGNKAVLAWLNYLGSAEAQERASEFLFYPLNPNAKASPKLLALEGMTMEELKKRLFKPDWNIVAANHEATVRRVEKIIGNLKEK